MLTQLDAIAARINLAPGARIQAIVRHQTSNSYPDYAGDFFIAELLVPTFAAGAARCRAGYNDVVLFMPGHAENVAATTFGSAIVTGTRFVGWPAPLGSTIPTFTWTGTTFQLACAVANVSFENLKFAMNGANDITKAMVFTGAGCQIVNCDFDMSAATDLHAAIGVEVGTAAHNFKFLRNRVLGASDAVTDCLKVAGVANGIEIDGNWFDCPGPAATTGIVNVAVAALRMKVTNNVFRNPTASSDFCLAFAAAASSGVVDKNVFCVLNDGTAATEGVTFGAGCLVQLGANLCSNKILESGALSPAASG